MVDFLTDEEIQCVHAATDITGFGLAGHGYQLAKASGVTLLLDHQKIPQMKKLKEALENGFITKAHKSNNEYTLNRLSFKAPLTDLEKLIYYDPQTSGGLLLSVRAKVAPAMVEKLKSHFPGTTIIGSVSVKSEYDVIVE